MKSHNKYKKYGKNDKPYRIIYWDNKSPSQVEEYRTKKEVDKVVKDLLNGKPLKVIDDLNNVVRRVYPVRFFITKQIGGNYCFPRP